MKAIRPFIAFFFLSCLAAASALAHQRPPATPLIVHDPYFSIWSTTDRLTDSETTHWTGSAQPINGIARIDGKPFRFMGRRSDAVPAMEQTATSITPTHTRYEFRQGGVTLELTFFTPAMMNDIDVLSRPVTYLSWTARSTDGAAHQVSLMLDVDPVIAVNDCWVGLRSAIEIFIRAISFSSFQPDHIVQYRRESLDSLQHDRQAEAPMGS